jgi:hypothetical protein
MDGNRMPPLVCRVDKHPDDWSLMGARTHNTSKRRLKSQVAHNSYTVDPQRVATAIIVRLVQEGPSAPDPFRGGPTRRAGAAERFRRAA